MRTKTKVPNSISSIDEMIRFSAKHGGGAEKDLAKGEKRKLVPELKANENVSSTANPEWYSSTGLQNDILNLIPEEGNLMPKIQKGFIGSNLPVAYPVPYDIEDQFMQLKAEWVNKADPSSVARAVTSNKTTLTQNDLIVQFNISDFMILHSTDKQLYNKIVDKASRSAIKTIESMIINGDTVATATGNVNSDDQLPATTFASTGGALDHRIATDGLRKTALTNGNTYNVAAFDSDDMMEVVKLLADKYVVDFTKLVNIMSPRAYLKALTDDSFKLAVNTIRPTIDQGKTLRPWNIETIIVNALSLTEADGKMSGTTPANNTQGQILTFYPECVQWGYGAEFKLETRRVEGHGFAITATMEFGFVVVDGANSVGLGINMEV